MDEDVGAFLDDVDARADAFLFGRRTYEIFAGPLGLDAFAISAALRLHSAKQVAIDVPRPARTPQHSLALARQTA